MSKNNKSDQSSRPKQGQAGHWIKHIRDGYQPEKGKLSPTKPPTNPPNKGSSGKK